MKYSQLNSKQKAYIDRLKTKNPQVSILELLKNAIVISVLNSYKKGGVNYDEG